MSIEILFSHEKERIRRPEDAVVCCLHCYMTVNGYKCIGSGEKVNNIVMLITGYCKYYIGATGDRPVHFLWSNPNPIPNHKHIPKTYP